MTHFSLFSGSANPNLANEISQILDHRLSPCQTQVFPDGELSVRLDEAVRGHPVFIIQPTAPPVTNHVFELMLFADACRRASSGHVTAVVPYFGYARSDKRHHRRESIAASMVARCCQAAGLGHLVTVDLHSPQIEGFFHIPVEHLTAVPVLCDELKGRLAPETVVVSPDEGRLEMATHYAQRLGLSTAIVHKQRLSGIETRVVKITGDVQDRPCLIIDDMIATGDTLARAMDALIKAGARPEFRIAATHGVLLEGARAKLSRPALQEIIITDSVAPHMTDWAELKIVSLAPLLAGAIHRLATRQSISDLYD
jgi:ribose-phosphate pyrophosphokinase